LGPEGHSFTPSARTEVDGHRFRSQKPIHDGNLGKAEVLTPVLYWGGGQTPLRATQLSLDESLEGMATKDRLDGSTLAVGMDEQAIYSHPHLPRNELPRWPDLSPRVWFCQTRQ
jgi:hypothetical protein